MNIDKPVINEHSTSMRLVANAERYYRVMYYGSRTSWNLRDRHMFDTLMELLAYQGEAARAVVWEHNSHIGDASATEMRQRGEFNVGQLCRQEFGWQAYLSLETELQSHYFFASLPRQFDEYVWFDETRAVTPLGPETAEGMPDTFPFGV